MVPLDPVSGNVVPPGAKPEEVRDDIPAKLSEGEFVIPANVVRFYGLKFFNNLMKKAKENLGETEEDELPFSVEELESEDTPVQMAGGGFVASGGGFSTTPIMEEDPIVPLFKRPRPVLNTAPDGEGSEPHEGPTGLAGSVDQWSVDNFTDYANNRGSLVNRGIQTFISKAVPFGGLAMRARYNYLGREVPTKLDQMIESGKDQKGNSLTPEQISALQDARSKLEVEEDFSPGLRGAVQEGMQSLFGKREKPEEPAPTARPNTPTVNDRSERDVESKRSRSEITGNSDSSDDVKSNTKETNKGGKTSSGTLR